MIPNTENSHFTVCFSLTETWLRLALEKITSKDEEVDLKVIVKSRDAEYKVVSNVNLVVNATQDAPHYMA